MVDFGGWDMPVNYGSQIEEHHAVRRAAGMFDVSHMCVIDVRGARAGEFLRGLLANDVARLTRPGKALYSCMLKDDAGILDDLIVYSLIRAGTAWWSTPARAMRTWPGSASGRRASTSKCSERQDLAMLAVQGPKARAQLATLLTPPDAGSALALAHFFGTQLGEWFVARTGYTGEDGFEVMVPAEGAVELWTRLIELGVQPCGLGARDTLRLEAGMNLYGNDMDEGTQPLESGLEWTVAFEPADRKFVGRAALEAVRHAGGGRKLVGLLLEDRAVMRSHQRVLDARGRGRGDQRYVLTHPGALDRTGARAGRRGRGGRPAASGHPRKGAAMRAWSSRRSCAWAASWWTSDTAPTEAEISSQGDFRR